MDKPSGKIKLILIMIAPLLQSVAGYLRNLDADDHGVDDTLAKVLKYASVALNAWLDDQPIPESSNFGILTS